MGSMGNLLINEPPLQVLPSLAVQVGLNEAIVLQQVHYWLRLSKNRKDGRIWVYKTYAEWQEEFPFWSRSTIIRTINNLEKQGHLISTSQYNKMKIDNTKWYTINDEKWMSTPPSQNEQTDYSNRVGVSSQNEQANNQETTQENTTENKKTDATASSDLFNSWWEIYNYKIGKPKAKSAFDKVLKSHSYDLVVEGTKRFIAEQKQKGTEKKYWPHPTTFLNQERFNDEYENTPKEKPPFIPVDGERFTLLKRMDDITYRLEREDDLTMIDKLDAEWRELDKMLHG